MIRVAEITLFLLPFAAYGLWRAAAARGLAGPSPLALSAIVLGLLAFGGGLAWFGVHQRLPDGARYVPATLRDGRVVPGHAG